MRFLVALLFVVLSINIFGSEYDEWYDSRGWWNISWKDTKTGITYQAKATYSFGNYTYSEDCYASISSDGINKEIVDFEPLSEVSFPAIKDGEGNITKYTKVPVNRIMGTISGDNIKSISFPESIVYFGNFNGVELRIECDNLQTIKFGDNNKIKDADNFCVSITSKYLESLIIPDGVKGLGYSTGGLDLHCPALKTVTIPKSVKLAGGEETPNGPTYSGALGSNCPNLETICFNDDVTTIPSLFGCCFNLKNIEWPSKVEKIEDYAFLGCTGLQSVKFPKTLNAIGRGAFLGCSGLKDIYVCWETPIEDEHYDTYLKSVNGEWVMSTITTFSGAHDTEKIRVNGIDLPTDEMINPGTYENAILHLVQDSPNEPGPSTYKYKRTSPWKYFRHIKHPGGLIHNFVITVTANGNGKVEYDHWTTIDDGQTTTVETCEVRNETKDFKVSTPTLPTEDEFKIVLDEGASLKSVTVDGKDMTNNVEIEQNTNTGILLLSNITGATTIDVKFSGAEDPKDNQTFTSKSAEGVEMTFTILDEQKKICMVGVDNTDKTWLNAVTAIDNNTTGKLTIPEKANGYVVEKVGDYAFYSCKISEIVLPEGLASIGTFAFANCPITSVTLPSTLTFIGSKAFTKLETVYSYVVDPFELSEKAFNYTNYQVAGGDGTTYYYYTANLYVPKGTKEKYASTPSWNHFMDNGDRIIEMENSEETYKDGDVFGVDVNGIWMVFRVLSAENKTVQIGSSTAENSNTTVDTAVNWETTNGVITIPSEVKGFKVIKIASGAFLKCANITEVIIPETVKSIGNRAFMSSGVSKVTIPEGVENIGDRAFLGSPITSVTLPSTLKFIGQFAFGWDGVAGHDRNDLEEIYCCVKEPFELSEKAFSYNRYIATSTGEELFRYTGKLYVPSGTKDKYLATPTWNWFTSSNIIEMGQAEDNIQFADSNVKAICVQNWDKDYDGELSKEEAATVKNIGTVFKETQIHMFNELQYFTGLTAIGNNAFRKCQMLTSIILPESIQKIGENAFTDCRELSALEIPATVTEIGQSVFAGCNHLIVTVAQGNKTFVAEDMMLYQKDKYGEQIETLLWCSPMKSGNVTINSAASTLADNCFYECGEIIGVEIPDNVKTLGDGVFVKCSKLENVFIGKGVESIGEGCFNATPKLRQITVYASNPYYAFDGGVLIKRQGNVLVAYPNAKGVQYKVREGIETIGKWAFYYTDIASITLPKTLTSIEDYAFYDCKNLTEIIVNAEAVPTVAAKSFGDVTFQQATLTVPAGMKSKYQAAEGWKNFQNIVEEGKQESIDPIETETVVNVNDLSGEDLTDNVIDDVYYNTGDGSYDATDGSIVISETTNMGLITNAEPGSDDVKNNFTGIILKVAAGKGTIKVNVKTSGNAQLVVQIGNGTPMIASKTEQGDVVVSYDVAEDTYVYIYAIIGSSASPSMRASSTDEVRIYGFTVSPGASGVKAVWASEDCNAQIFSLDGKPLNEPQKGVNIVRMNNGQVRKVVVK